jgi:ectoine hydroxylase-related dioxygenase (phytanoyl-CoA dioxygenase family)
MGAHFWCKLPGDGKTVAWHQDAAYWLIRPAAAITVWLALDKADRENAAMKFVSGSHLLGRLESTAAENEDASVLPVKVMDAERLGSVVYSELLPGEASVHSDLVLHGSDRNNSSRRRCGLALRYCATFAVPPERFRRVGVLVAGKLMGDWANLPRPDSD